ncbi:MAG: hypothetical protein NTW66_00860 [Candidatus Magasanikbacteria bacterium]|nr:hypothetical protein [Candidatus Magasanikbacteria bacterium]
MINFYNQQNRDNYVDSHGAGAPAPIKNGKPVKPSLSKYTDPTNEFGSGQFKWAMWYVKNKVLLYRLAVASLFAFCALTIGFSIWKAVELLVYDLTVKPIVEQQLAASIDFTALHPRFSPSSLEILNSYVLPGGTEKVDALAEVANPNERYIAIFDYFFDFGSTTTARHTTMLLPMESRPVAIFGLDSAEYSGSANFVIDNLRWRRVSAHQVADTRSWQEERLNFTIENFTFGFAGSTGEAAANSLRFALKNDTAYGYKNPVFYLGLYQSGPLVGIMKFDLLDFQSLESRQIDLRNFVQNLSVSEIKVFPIIDLYDKAVYLAPKGI